MGQSGRGVVTSGNPGSCLPKMRVNLSGSFLEPPTGDPRAASSRPDPIWWDQPEAQSLSEVPSPTRLDASDEEVEGYLPGGPLSAIPEDIEESFQMAMAGLLPRSRELKPWEPEKLNPRHLQILMLKATGLKNNVIARLLNVGEPNVSIVVNHPDSQLILARMLASASKQVIDVEAKIQAAAPAITERLIGIAMNSKSEQVAAKVGFGLLDRAGYGVKQKVEADVKHSLNVSPEHAHLLAAAIREASSIQDADYVIVDRDDDRGGLPPGGQANGLSEGGPPQQGSGDSDTDEPPVSSPQYSSKTSQERVA